MREDLILEQVADVGECCANPVRHLDQSCESPIERAALLSLIEDDWVPANTLSTFRQCRPMLEPILGSRGLFFHREFGACIAAQSRVRTNSGREYRLDFALLLPDGRKYCLELDGHDFHERTKEQAARDRSRDRDVTIDGWRAERFTGSEIHASYFLFADTVAQLANAGAAR